MMKFIFMMCFMMLLSFLNEFWLIQVLWFLMTFLFIINFSFNYLYLNISFNLGFDLLSYLLVLLSFWICSLMIMASEKVHGSSHWKGMFLSSVVLLMLFLYLTFSSMNVFIFYVFFEASLIPTFFLILGWGYQPERLQAGIYLLFYTLFASLPMMISLFYCYYLFNSFDFFFFGSQVDSLIVYCFINVVFLIKMPMFFVHLWLPKAHVEAPISGSMILAGVMLKLGGYGMLRFMLLFMYIGMKINFFIVSVSMVGGFIICLICLRQSDMKSLIAYSSVSHMSLVLCGIMTLNYWGFSGALVMMIGHGLCSSGLFCLANISYERLFSRSLYLNKGLINILPSLSLFWFMLISSNMAAPPSFNLAGEIMLINSVISFSSINVVFLALISFFGAAYCLYLYSYSQHGFLYSGSFSVYSCYIREYLLLMLHWLPLNLIFLGGDIFLFWF